VVSAYLKTLARERERERERDVKDLKMVIKPVVLVLRASWWLSLSLSLLKL
jgi:hypothetical protein